MSLPSPQVSVIMAMRNSARTLLPALHSIRAQRYRDWEMILIDDGSTDDSAALVRRVADERIRLFADGRWLGLAARLNEGLDAARGRFIARMDADDVAYPERLALQAEFLDNNPQIDLLGCGMLVFRDDGAPLGSFPVQTTHEAICARPYAGFQLAHPTWMGRASWFRRWRYDPRCLKAQDQDLLLRAFEHSRFAAMPEILLGYRQDSPSLRKSWHGRLTFSRSIWRHAREHCDRAAGVIAVGEQVLKFAYDALAIGTSASRLLLRHRAQPASELEFARWREVWRASKSVDNGT